MITLALDISTHSTGAAIFKDQQLIHHECIVAASANAFNRIDKMSSRIEQLVKQYSPTDVAVESPLPADVGHNIDTYRKLTWAQGIIGDMLNKHSLRFNIMYIPSQWRKKVEIKTGPGKMRPRLKADDIKMVKFLYGLDVNDDEADAILIGRAYTSQHEDGFNWE